jgi:hypothetical protein
LVIAYLGMSAAGPLDSRYFPLIVHGSAAARLVLSHALQQATRIAAAVADPASTASAITRDDRAFRSKMTGSAINNQP